MKKLAWFCISAMTVSSFIACGVKDRSQLPARIKQSDKTLQKTQDKKVSAEACIPGKAGSITIGGALVQTVDGAQRPIESLQIASIAGRKAGAATAAAGNNVYEVDRQALSEAKVKELEDLSKDTTYVKLGCEESALPATFKTWKELQLNISPETSSVEIKANTVFVCGLRVVDFAPSVSITAHEIVLDQGAFALRNQSAGVLSITAESIKIEGNGQIAVETKDENLASETSGIALGIHVTKQITGGNLKLLSQGRSCSGEKAEEKKSDDKSAQEDEKDESAESRGSK